jgi:DNA-binding NtrC family response regulator
MPPLRDRLEDIPILAMYFARKYGKKNAKKIRMIDENAIARLKRHNWPGNVRELENTIERAVALTASDIISEDLLWRSSKVIGKDNLHPASPDISQEEGYLKEIIHRDTKQAIIKALEVTKGNRSKAARILGISRASLYQKLKQYQLYQS